MRADPMLWNQILSLFTGAARELIGAYNVNPYHPEEIADTLFAVLESAREDRAARMESMRTWVKEHNIYNRAAQFLMALTHLSPGD
jgi:trehalose-6-phosphate synthase